MRDLDETLWRLLRVGAAMCFIGHGAFGIIGKAAWLPFFGVVGIGPEAAWRIMPLVGVVDVAMGVLALVSPRPAVWLYMAAWGLWTAALRPLAGQSAWELVERAGNYGVPLALLLLSSRPASWRGWLAPAQRREDARVAPALTATAALLLLGHGMLGVARSPLLATHYGVLGLGADVVPLVGLGEVVAAGLLVLRPSAGLALAIAAWKVATESLFLAAGAPVWEVIERGGSYAAPAALALLLWRRHGFGIGGAGVRATVVAALVIVAHPSRAHAQAYDAVFPLPAARTAPADPATMGRALRAGGLVLACRHTVTDDGTDTNGNDFSDHVHQRNLTAQGRDDARALGRAIREAGVPVGEVRASPMWRTTETAQLAFGAVKPDTLLVRRTDGPGTRALFMAPVAAGTNRVLVTHTGILIRILSKTGLTPVPEGGCIVLRARGDSVAALGLMRREDWAAAR